MLVLAEETLDGASVALCSTTIGIATWISSWPAALRPVGSAEARRKRVLPFRGCAAAAWWVSRLGTAAVTNCPASRAACLGALPVPAFSPSVLRRSLAPLPAACSAPWSRPVPLNRARSSAIATRTASRVPVGLVPAPPWRIRPAGQDRAGLQTFPHDQQYGNFVSIMKYDYCNSRCPWRGRPCTQRIRWLRRTPHCTAGSQ